jgi:DNA (cytosine-5)-methyltransferase 1
MTFGSLFSGIGGMDLGLERAGMECRWQVEIDPYCSRVLEKHWPYVKRYGDIRTVTALERVDLVAGGFPCQDVSWAGRRAGIDGARSGLWGEFQRLVSEIRPPLVLVENVPGLLHRGIGRVLGSLAEIGYDAEWDCIPACAFGAPHTRERLFILAYPAGQRQGQLRRQRRQIQSAPEPNLCWAETEPGIKRVADGVPNRVERLTAIGNAVVPQVAEWIGRRIIEAAA